MSRENSYPHSENPPVSKDIQAPEKPHTPFSQEEEAWFSRNPRERTLDEEEDASPPSWYGKNQFETFSEEVGNITKGALRATNVLSGKEKDSYAQNIKDLPRMFLEAPRDLLEGLRKELFEKPLADLDRAREKTLATEERAIHERFTLFERVASSCSKAFETLSSFSLPETAPRESKEYQGLFSRFSKKISDTSAEYRANVEKTIAENTRGYSQKILHEITTSAAALVMSFSSQKAPDIAKEDGRYPQQEEVLLVTTNPELEAIRSKLERDARAQEENLKIAMLAEKYSRDFSASENTRIIINPLRTIAQRRFIELTRSSGDIQEKLTALSKDVEMLTASEDVLHEIQELQSSLATIEKKITTTNDLLVRYTAEHLARALEKLPEELLPTPLRSACIASLYENPHEADIHAVKQRIEEFVSYAFYAYHKETPEALTELQHLLNERTEILVTQSNMRLKEVSAAIQKTLTEAARNLLPFASHEK